MPPAQLLLTIAVGGLALMAVRTMVRRAPARLRLLLGTSRVSPGLLVALGATIGGLAGLVASGHLAIRHLVEREIARGFGWEIVWMGPASAAVAFGLLAALLAIAFPSPGKPDAAEPTGAVALAPGLFVLVASAAFTVLQEPRLGLYAWSAWSLSLGLAALAVRAASARPDPVLARQLGRLTRLALPLLLLLVLAGLWQLPRLREARALARLPPTDGRPPNVLLLVLDTVRAASLGLYGHPRPTTPHLERLAARGVVFDWAIATAPWTLPSHGSMFTGLYPGVLAVGPRVPLAERHLTLAEVLRDKGYATAGFVANMAYTTRISGLAQGFARYEDRPMSWGRFIESSWFPRILGRRLLPLSERPWRGRARKHAEHNVDDFLAWLDSRREPARPFFAFLNFIDAHDPYFAPKRLRDRFDPPGPRIVERRRGITEEQLASTRAAYEASIARIDEQLGRLEDELERRGLLEGTLVIVVSDHGEHFGEHGLQFHGNSLYRPLIRVPLVVVYPPLLPGGLRVPTPVSIRDIPRTVLHVVEGPADRTFPGRSLVEVAHGLGAAALEPLPSSTPSLLTGEPWEPAYRRSLRSVFQHPYHLIRDSEGKVELYHVVLDPEERRNLAFEADPRLLQRLQHTLDSLSLLDVPVATR